MRRFLHLVECIKYSLSLIHILADFAREELMSGVTTIRTVGGLGNFDTRLRDEIKAGKKMGPRILAANQGISCGTGKQCGVSVDHAI